MSEIEAAYGPFTTALRGGGFGEPVDPDEWPAELIAAHVIMNNDLFTEAARAVKEGRVPTYDNERTHDGDALREVLVQIGSLPELAHEVERSASDLQAAYDMLDAAQRATMMLTRIYHEGALIVDDERPIGTMIEGNAGFHLEAHHKQLLELRED